MIQIITAFTGTHWSRDIDLAKHFVVPLDSQRFAVASLGEENSTCIISNNTRSLLLANTTEGTSTIKSFYYDEYVPSRSVITCTKPVSIHASIETWEYNLYGAFETVKQLEMRTILGLNCDFRRAGAGFQTISNRKEVVLQQTGAYVNISAFCNYH